MKKIITALVVLILIGIVGYVAWTNKAAIEEWLRGKITGFFMEQAGVGTGNVSIPEITTAPKSLGATPEINPIDKTNPFRDIKTNPFE